MGRLSRFDNAIIVFVLLEFLATTLNNVRLVINKSVVKEARLISSLQQNTLLSFSELNMY